MSDFDTFPKYLLRNAEIFGDRPSMRHKDLGIWKTWTWSEALDEVRSFSVGLGELGLRRDDRVAIVGSNRPVLYWGFCAVQALGGVPVPVYSDSVADEMVYVLEHAEVRFAVVQDQEQVDKLLSLRERLPNLVAIIYDEPRGLRDYDEDILHHIVDVQGLGREALSRRGDKDWLSSVGSGVGSDLSVMLYTSGTTGKPKGVMLSYDNLIISSNNANEFDNLTERDEIIAYLPLAWVGDHIFSYGQSLTSGYCVCCPESMDTVTENRREIAPTYFFAPPRVFESLLTDITVRMEDASRLKRCVFDYFLGVANRVGQNLLDNKSVSLPDRIMYFLGEVLVYGPLKNRLGMTHLRVAYTAGEAIGPEIFRFYRSLGLNLKQLYGQTEASVYITAQPDGQISAETVGTPSPDVEIDIGESGEVLYRSPGVFIGYYKNDDATRETKTSDGWVRTGDAGFIDQRGHLRIIDRAKDVGKLNDGSLFPPKYIENKLKFYPNVKEAVALGDGRDFVSVMLNIDLQPVANWAERHNISYGSYQELANHPEVYEMIASHIDEVNRDLSSEPRMSGAQISRFLVLHKELDADDGELTRTMKVRRSLIHERYTELIAALYDGSTERHIETDVTFEDGRRGSISATVQIRDTKVYESREVAA